MSDLPKPNTDTEVYLAAVVARLDKVLDLLTPKATQAEPAVNEPPRVQRRRTPTK